MIDAVFWWAWLGAARVTRMLPADDVFLPVHQWVERRRIAAVGRSGLAELPDAKRRRAWRISRGWTWLGALISCMWCWGTWVFLAETALAAFATTDTASWRVLDGPWWFTIPHAALGVQWVLVTIMVNADPVARAAHRNHLR